MCEIPPLQNPGTYLREDLPPGWENVVVDLRRGNGQHVRRVEILDVANETLYSQEPLNMIAFKCFGLFAFINSTYFILYTLQHFMRLVLVPIVNVSLLAIFKEAWKIVQIPFLYIGMQFASLYGIFKPLEGRALFAKFESILHDGKTRRDAEQYQKIRRTNSELAWDALCEENPRTAFFVGFCMQPYGSTHDPHITLVAEGPLRA